jgi:hypothetical protein
MSKTAKKANPSTETETEKPEKHDKSRAGTLRRLAKAYAEASVWDNQTVAAMFYAEADLLDPPPKAESEGYPEK